jgi:N-acyl-D-aspartate/D-glutamate deacylase
MTQAPAQLFGLTDRGEIREGAHADLVLVDPEVVESELLSMVHDLPGTTSRLYAGSVGVRSVFVGGVEVVHDGESTGARPGQLLRSGVDTETVSIG